MSKSIQTWTCGYCGKKCEREAVRGTRPKWCSPACANRGPKQVRGTCKVCGLEFIGYSKELCSRQCSSMARRKPLTARPKQDKRSPLRRAYEDGDWPAVRQILLANTTTVDGCSIWLGRIKRGDPQVSLGASRDVHRLMLEAKHGAPLGSQAAHHTCGVPACINPEHLQPVTHSQNTAEMLARRTYVKRIEELESELRRLDPTNSLLDLIPVARA